MDRRRFLAAAGTGITAVSAGCLGIGVPGTGGYPLAGTTPTVRVDDNSDGPHDVETNAREALSFWEEHSEEYAGFEVGFELVDGDDPDMVIAYGDDPRGCEGVPNYSSRVLGCAPLLRSGSSAGPTGTNGSSNSRKSHPKNRGRRTYVRRFSPGQPRYRKETTVLI